MPNKFLRWAEKRPEWLAKVYHWLRLPCLLCSIRKDWHDEMMGTEGHDDGTNPTRMGWLREGCEFCEKEESK